ncbi:MAG: hypothetical protein IT430_05415 [Phycisphaerales bacterium]|nr:hypothetical protein [Phycisphaerales bacterium]
MSHAGQQDWSLSRDEFADALRKGLGRVVLQVQRHGAADRLDLIEDACATDQRYDQDCEDDRHEWLRGLAVAAGAGDAVRDRLIEIARQAPDDADIWHPLCVLGHFARQGDAAALAAVRDRFDRDAARGCRDNGASMVIAQPIEGLLLLAETFGDEFPDEHDWLPCAWRSRARDLDGEAAVNAALETAAEDSLRVAAFARLAESPYDRFFAASENSDTSADPHPDVCSYVFNADDPPADFHKTRSRARTWSTAATEEELEAAAHTLIAETDPERVAVLCSVFRYPRTPFPLDIAPLIDKARASRDERERYCLLQIIVPFDDERVRELALELLNRCGPASDILDLFIENYRPGDGELIRRALVARPLRGVGKEIDDVHGVAMAISKVFSDDSRNDGGESLLWAYEHTPCSMCRRDIVDALIRMRAAPEWLLQECLCDCADDTRVLVGKAIEGE